MFQNRKRMFQNRKRMFQNRKRCSKLEKGCSKTENLVIFFKKCAKVQSHIARQKWATRTHFARTVPNTFPHALLHAHRTCGSAILRTCAPQPNICEMCILHWSYWLLEWHWGFTLYRASNFVSHLSFCTRYEFFYPSIMSGAVIKTFEIVIQTLRTFHW